MFQISLRPLIGKTIQKKIFLCILLVCIILFFEKPSFLSASSTETKIPKIIHYVWVGKKPLPDHIKENIETWKKHAPDYQIKQWDETNCDVNENDFVKSSYQAGNWAFVSDWCRFKALYDQGGIYLDTDTVLKKSIDDLLIHSLFVTFEHNECLSSAFIGTIPKNKIIKTILEEYPKKEWGGGSPHILTVTLTQKYPTLKMNEKKQNIGNLLVLPPNFGLFDFGGGENYLEHFYAFAWHGEPRRQGPYYTVFKEKFLSEHALLLKYKEKQEYLIPLTENSFYSFETKKKADVQINESLLIVNWEDGNIEYFIQKENFYKHQNNSK